MRNVLGVSLALALLAATAGTSGAGVNIGGGVHYLHNVADIDANGVDFDKDNFGFLGSIMAGAAMLKLEGQVEYIPDYLGTSEDLWIPQAYALFGSVVYAGAGIGIGHFHDDWMDDPFYALRAGVNLPLGAVGLDMYGTYHFWNNDAFEDVNGDDLDSITFAALLRFNLGGD